MCVCVYDEESKSGWECVHTTHMCVTGVEHHCLPVRSVCWLYMFYSANIDTALLPLHYLFCLHSSSHLVGSAALPSAIQNPTMCLCQLALHCQFYFISSLAVFGTVLMKWWIFRLFRALCEHVNCIMLQEMIFNAGVIIFYLLGDIFISLYSTGCSNMIAYKAGAVSIAA